MKPWSKKAEEDAALHADLRRDARIEGVKRVDKVRVKQKTAIKAVSQQALR